MLDHLRNIPSEETPPKAGAMINTFRAFGYNLQTAVADILDNSISAKAENIWIQYEWDGEKSWVSITDDGQGMDKDELITAMTPGSKDPKDERLENDLGRFGLGLKTSSFSQCKALTVITKKKDYNVIKRHWDLDFVNETGKWKLLDYLSDSKFMDPLNNLEKGTTVLWEKLDRLVGNANRENQAALDVFLAEFESVEDHLSLVFHRYLEQHKIKIFVNGNKLEPWDPFIKLTSQLLAKEYLDRGQVQVKCYALPHISMISEEERKKAKTDEWYDLQGFYIYRQNRLLLHGDWLGLFSKNEHFKNARILIDIPNNLDHEWKIDIKKATATPSFTVRKDLIRLGKMTRSRAAAIHKFIGNQFMLDDSIKSFDFQPVWKARKTRDSRHYYINEDHPIVSDLLTREQITSKDLRRILKLIGETTPIEAIIQYHSEEPESHELRRLGKELEPGIIELATLYYSSLLASGMSKDVALKNVFKLEPFNEYPTLITYLT
jgi:hypothetical protein